jgi:nitrogen fixation NifU-like protein
MNEYHDIILDHYRDPQNFGSLEHATHVGELRNLSCGDHIKLYFLIENDMVQDVKFEGSGCAISTAASSMVTEKIKGMSIQGLRAFHKEDVLELLGVEISPGRLKCALLSLEAVRKALNEKE